MKPEDKSRSIDLHSPKATLHQEPVPSAEALERMDDLASRLFGVEGTVAELKAVQKHYQDEVQSRITPLDNRITKSVQETQRAIKGLETKQVSNEAEVRRFTRRLDSTAEKVDSFCKSVDKLEKELFNAIDSHSHEVATLPNSRKQAKVNRSKTLREIIAELA